MRPCSAALKSFLEGSAREAIQIDLYTFALASGEVYRWTSGVAPMTVPSAGFPSTSINAGFDCTFARGPGFGRSNVTTQIGIEPAALSLEVYSGAVIQGNYGFADLARLGLLDNAEVELDRFFASPSAPLDTSLGVIVPFRGRIAESEIGRSVVRLKVKSVLNRLATAQFPPRLYSSSCSHVFGTPMCDYDRVAGKNALGVSTGWGEQTIAALSGSSQTEIHASYVPGVSPSPYNEGTITGATGGNAGASRTIRFHDGGIAYFNKPFLSTVAVGDTFNILPGCIHNADYCDTVLNNRARYGGFNHILPPESGI